MMNAKLHLTADRHVRASEHIESISDTSVGRIFERHDAILNVAARHFFENGRNRSDRHEFDALTEAMNRREMTVSILWAKKRDADCTFDGARTADQLAINRS